MMPERRQAHRREPIVVEVRGEDVEARPLPWIQRNDLGNAVIGQYTSMLNSTMRSYVNPKTNAPELQMYLNDKLGDPVEILNMAYPGLDIRDEWEWPELYELIYAALDVNELGHLKDLIDPNFRTPTNDGGTSSSGMAKRVEGILNLPSSLSSESSESEMKTSEDSPMEKSSTSSEKETENSGTKDGGSSA
jgi:hypothetical protein